MRGCWLARVEQVKKSKGRRVAEIVLAALAIAFVATRLAPETLIWPYEAKIGETQIYSEQPITPEMASVLARSDVLLRKSEIYSAGYGKRIFLTNGRWRWKFLSLTLSGAFGHSSGLTEAIVVNRNSIANDLVRNGKAIGGERKLSSLIAHERTHGLIRAHFGRFRSRLFPTWKIEGYSDYIAGQSSLSAANVAELKRRGEQHPAMVYYKGRKKVMQALDVDGKTVDELFAQ